MTAVLAIIAAVALLYGAAAWNAVRSQRERVRRMRVKWEDCVTDRWEKSLVFEWSCRDLIPEWEQLYPHVRNMQPARKYSEWATFCANYPTRESIIAHLDLEL